MRAGIIDVAIGNVGSLAQAFRRIGVEVALLNGPSERRPDDVLVLPGVGAARPVAERLAASGWAEELSRTASEGGAILGICLGMQLFFGRSAEGGEGLHLLAGPVVPLSGDVPLPHMGWNRVVPLPGKERLFQGLVPGECYFYFAHSYVVAPRDEADVVAVTDYGVRFPAVVQRGRIIGTQFHPEKSGRSGLRFLQNVWEVLGWSASQPSTFSVAG